MREQVAEIGANSCTDGQNVRRGTGHALRTKSDAEVTPARGWGSRAAQRTASVTVQLCIWAMRASIALFVSRSTAALRRAS